MKGLFAAVAVVFPISVVMAMTGRGGGSFYVAALVLTLCKGDTQSSRPNTVGVRGKEMFQ